MEIACENGGKASLSYQLSLNKLQFLLQIAWEYLAADARLFVVQLFPQEYVIAGTDKAR